ncbi:MAG: ABC transporter substrate-binding protein [Alphaproteobacteria bacterium]
MTKKFTRRDVVKIGGGVALGAGLLPTLSQLVLAESAKDVLVIAWPNDVQSWDVVAHTQAPAMPMFKAVFDQPLDQSPDLKLGPGVVRSWKWIEEGKVLELTFRDDVVFHNGDKMTTADFRFSYFERPKEDGKLGIAATIFRNLEDIEIKSPTVALVKLKQAFPTLLNWMALFTSFIMPKKYFTEIGGKEKFLEKPVGSGPYKLVEYQRGSRMVFEAFDKYWGPKPKVKRVVVQILKDASARVAAVQSKQVDIAYDVPLKEAVRLGKIPGLKSIIAPVTNIVLLQIKNDGPTADQNVRLAMHHAIDKRAISRALYEGLAPAISFLGVPGMPGEPKGFEFTYDPKKSVELLKKSGYSTEKPAKFVFNSFRGVFPGDWEMANILAQMWKKVGIEVTIEQLEQPQYYELNHSGKLQGVTLFNWANPSADPELFTGYIMNPKLRYSAWKSADMEPIMGKLFQESNYDKRIKEYEKVNRMVMEQAYSIPILQQVGTIAHTDKVTINWYKSGWIRYAEISKA